MWWIAAGAWAGSRVVVLGWPQTSVDETTPALQRTVAARIGAGAAFLPPEVLYRPGRVAPAAEAAPVGVVPTSGDLAPADWLLLAAQERAGLAELPFVDDDGPRAERFARYVAVAVAAERSGMPSPPFFERFGGTSVNRYAFLAAGLADEDPALLDTLAEPEARDLVAGYVERLQGGEFATQTVSFAIDGVFDPSRYEVRVDGIRRDPSPDGRLDVSLGEHDVQLLGADGSLGPSVRVERNTPADQPLEVLTVARTRMQLDLILSLMTHPADCTPEISADFPGLLEVEAALHPDDALYLALPQLGSTSAKKLLLWRWNATEDRLELLDRAGDCPDAG